MFVTGGLNDYEGTCPFNYTYITNYNDLVETISNYEMVLYHWLPSWAIRAVKDSGVKCVEFVHRTDTSECDKTVPDVIVSHSQYVCDYIKEKYKRVCYLVPNVVNTDFYTPSNGKSKIIGTVTSYYDTKGIDILIKAWKEVESLLPEYRLQIYGSGEQRGKFEAMAAEIGSKVEFYGPVKNSKIAYDNFQLVVSASRIEGLPVALLEALSCNVPVLASDIEGHRVINEIAEKKGYKPPISLFKCDDYLDLANNIVLMLNSIPNNEINVRDVAVNIFSSKQHIDGLNSAFYIADICSNKMTNVFYNKKKTQFQLEQHSAIDVTFDKPYEYAIDIPLDVETIAFNVELSIEGYCGVFMQIEMYSDFNMVFCEGEGIYLDARSTNAYIIKDVPTETMINRVRIIVRPNENEFFIVNNVVVSLYN